METLDRAIRDAGRISYNDIERILNNTKSGCGSANAYIKRGLADEDQKYISGAIRMLKGMIKDLEDVKDACDIFEEDFR